MGWAQPSSVAICSCLTQRRGPWSVYNKPPHVNPQILGLWIWRKTWFLPCNYGSATCYMQIFLGGLGETTPKYLSSDSQKHTEFHFGDSVLQFTPSFWESEHQFEKISLRIFFYLYLNSQQPKLIANLRIFWNVPKKIDEEFWVWYLSKKRTKRCSCIWEKPSTLPIVWHT